MEGVCTYGRVVEGMCTYGRGVYLWKGCVLWNYGRDVYLHVWN